MPDSAIRRRLVVSQTCVLAEEFSRHRDRLLWLIRHRLDPILANRVDPDDVLQESWLAASRRVEHFLGNKKLSMFSWLTLIVEQTLTDVQRRHLGAKMRNVYREQSFCDGSDSRVGPRFLAEEVLIGELTSVSQAAIQKERADMLREVIHQLDDLDREIILLRHFEQLSNSETAKVLGIKQPAASNRYMRALQRLARALKQLPNFVDDLLEPAT